MANAGKTVLRKALTTSLILLTTFTLGKAILKASHAKDADYKAPSALMTYPAGKYDGVDLMTYDRMSRRKQNKAPQDKKSQNEASITVPVRMSDSKKIVLYASAGDIKKEISTKPGIIWARQVTPGKGATEVVLDNRVYDIGFTLEKHKVFGPDGKPGIPLNAYVLPAAGELDLATKTNTIKGYIVIPGSGMIVGIGEKPGKAETRIMTIMTTGPVQSDMPYVLIKDGKGEDCIAFIYKNELYMERLDHTGVEIIDISDKVGNNGMDNRDIRFELIPDSTQAKVFIKGTYSFTFDLQKYDLVSK